MVHLNRSSRLKILSTILVGIFAPSLKADVISFFDPLPLKKDTLSIKTNFFIANDPLPLYYLFHGWKKGYHPKDGKNIALLESRIDINKIYDDLTIGYFYQYNAFIKTTKDFTTLVYLTKNKLNLQKAKKYNLDLQINGIKQQGLNIAKLIHFNKNNSNKIELLLGAYLSYATDMQEGYIKGDGISNSKKDYNILANSSYFYTHNYLYKLKTDDTNGFGFGTNISIIYKNLDYNYKIKLLVNDLFASIYWKDLPYSKISIKTKNKKYDNNGYAKYNPSISGLELYKDHWQQLKTSYKFETQVSTRKMNFIAGVDSKYDELFPYLKIQRYFTPNNKLSLLYETRFKSFGMAYKYKAFQAGFTLDKFSDMSTVGLFSNFYFKF